MGEILRINMVLQHLLVLLSLDNGFLCHRKDDMQLYRSISLTCSRLINVSIGSGDPCLMHPSFAACYQGV